MHDLKPLIEQVTGLLLAVALGMARPLGLAMVVLVFTRMSIGFPIRAGFAMAISLPGLAPTLASLRVADTPPLLIGALGGKEIVVGIVIGLLFGIPFWGLQGAGETLDTQRSAPSAGSTDPSGGPISPAAGLLVTTASCLFVAAGGFGVITSTLLLGTVRRDGARIRVTVRLVDAITGYQIWTQSYDRAQGGLLSVEGEVATAVMASLKIVLMPDVISQVSLGGTSNGDAFHALLAGIARADNPDRTVAATAITFYDKAIALDPDYAHAYVVRARFWSGPHGAGDYKKSAADAQHAISLAPDLGEAHAAWAYSLGGDMLDFPRADAEIRRAMALAPGDYGVVLTYSTLLSRFGHPGQAIEAARKAVSLDPLSQTAYRVLAFALALDGQYAEARVTVAHAHTIRPVNNAMDGKLLAAIAMFEGNGAAAQQACEGRKDFFGHYCLAVAYHALGRQADADAELQKLRAIIGDSGAFQYMEVYASWGNTEEAVRWLDTAFRNHDPGLALLRADPLLKSITGTPEYRKIVQAMGLPL